jgi:hypothetical protein
MIALIKIPATLNHLLFEKYINADNHIKTLELRYKKSTELHHKFLASSIYPSDFVQLGQLIVYFQISETNKYKVKCVKCGLYSECPMKETGAKVSICQSCENVLFACGHCDKCQESAANENSY